MSHTKEIKYIISEPALVANKDTHKIIINDQKIMVDYKQNGR